MTILEKIQKKVAMPYSLKHYLSSSSAEFSKFDYSEKIEFLQQVVQKGFSTYDLSEAFRKSQATIFSHEDMQKEMVNYISYLMHHHTANPIVIKYYEGMTDEEVAKDLDAFLLSDDCYEDFKQKLKAKFDISL